MDTKTVKETVKVVLEIATAIAGVYAFWKSHRDEIKGLIQPVFDGCLKLASAFGNVPTVC